MLVYLFFVILTSCIAGNYLFLGSVENLASLALAAGLATTHEGKTPRVNSLVV